MLCQIFSTSLFLSISFVCCYIYPVIYTYSDIKILRVLKAEDVDKHNSAYLQTTHPRLQTGKLIKNSAWLTRLIACTNSVIPPTDRK